MGNRRVGIGKLGEDGGTAKWGIRVSRSGYHAVPTTHDNDIVAIDQLAFDSLNPVGHFPIYRIYDVTVGAATARTDTVYDAGETPASYAHTANSYTGTYGETLSYVPIPYCCEKDGSTLYGDRYQRLVGWDWEAADHFNLNVDYGGWADVTKTGFTVYNMNLSSTTFRLFLLDATVL
jgi:hypothetical protein